MLALPWAIPAWKRRLQRRDAASCCRWYGSCWCSCSSDPVRQARHVHPAGAADAVSGAGAAAAGDPARTRATVAARLRRGVLDGAAGARVWDAVPANPANAVSWMAAMPASRNGPAAMFVATGAVGVGGLLWYGRRRARRRRWWRRWRRCGCCTRWSGCRSTTARRRAADARGRCTDRPRCRTRLWWAGANSSC